MAASPGAASSHETAIDSRNLAGPSPHRAHLHHALVIFAKSRRACPLENRGRQPEASLSLSLLITHGYSLRLTQPRETLISRSRNRTKLHIFYN